MKYDWDSSFFGYPVGALYLDDFPVDENVLKSAIHMDKELYRLIYIFLKKDTFLPISVCSELNIQLADNKVTFSKSIETSVHTWELPDCIKEVGVGDYEKLEPLALQSGIYSRFRTDKSFKNNEYERLYREWLMSSLNGKIADFCMAYYLDNNPIGLITLKRRDQSIEIGIIAVDFSYRGRGIGSILLDAAERVSLKEKRTLITVATQKANITACRFYEANGFDVQSVSTIYHFWNEHYNTL